MPRAKKITAPEPTDLDQLAVGAEVAIVFDEYASVDADPPAPSYLIEPGQSFTPEQWDTFSAANEDDIRFAIDDYETLVHAIDPDAQIRFHWLMSSETAASYVRGLTDTQGVILALLTIPSSYDQAINLAAANVRTAYYVIVDWETGEVSGTYDLR